MTERCDVVVAGGGLAGGLIALRLKAAHPGLRVIVLERAPAERDDHTWSFFESDVAPSAFAWLRPLTTAFWSAYKVEFPALERDVATGYASIHEATLREALAAALGKDFRTGAEVESLTGERVVCHDGRVIQAPLVIDAKGATASSALQLAWQKFVGLELRLSAPHPLDRPVVMDATVPQLDGFRFVYLLPFAPDRLLVEDTRYSDGPTLDLGEMETGVLAYARARGLRIETVIRREHGVLPVVLSGDLDAYWAELRHGAAVVGVRAALFHPTTGYSLPEAVRLADAIAGAPTLSSKEIAAMSEARSRRIWREGGFYRALNRMMFKAAAPQDRYRVLQRFYGLPRPLIERFYAGRLTLPDQLRILAGKPPVPIGRALTALRGKALHAA